MNNAQKLLKQSRLNIKTRNQHFFTKHDILWNLPLPTKYLPTYQRWLLQSQQSNKRNGTMDRKRTDSGCPFLTDYQLHNHCAFEKQLCFLQQLLNFTLKMLIVYVFGITLQNVHLSDNNRNKIYTKVIPQSLGLLLRQFAANFIIIQYKEYSIQAVMESSELKISQTKRNGQQCVKKCEKLKNEEQEVVKERKDAGWILKEQSRAVDRNFENQMWQKQPEALMDVNFWKILLIGLTIAEFSIQISVIVIQYSSSKISLLPFIISLTITLILELFVFICLKILKISKISQGSKVQTKSLKPQLPVMNQEQIPTPTLQKIKKTTQVRMLQKTLKLKPLSSIISRDGTKSEALKQLKEIHKQHYQKQTISILSSISINTNMYLIIVTKSIQLLFSLIACTICFATIQNPIKYGFSYVALFLIFFYVLATFSFASLICLCMKIQQNLLKPVEPKQNQQPIVRQKRQSQVIQNQLSKFQKTILSIDKYIPSSKDKNLQLKEVGKSVQSEFKTNQYPDSIKSNPNQPAPNVSKQPKNLKKCLTCVQTQTTCEQKDPAVKVLKKSLLKSPKICQNKVQTPRAEEDKNQLHVQRRRVEINSKKIQYFEYANISPENSERLSEDQQPHPDSKAIKEKQKLRSKYLQQKLVQEEKLLQRKREENSKRAIKSAKLASQEKETQIKLKLETSIVSNIENFSVI